MASESSGGIEYEARMCYTMSIRSALADSKGKRKAGDVEMAEEQAYTIGVPEIPYELDPRLSTQ